MLKTYHNNNNFNFGHELSPRFAAIIHQTVFGTSDAFPMLTKK